MADERTTLSDDDILTVPGTGSAREPSVTDTDEDDADTTDTDTDTTDADTDTVDPS